MVLLKTTCIKYIRNFNYWQNYILVDKKQVRGNYKMNIVLFQLINVSFYKRNTRFNKYLTFTKGL